MESGEFATVHPRYGVASLSDVLPSALAVLGAPGADRLGLAEKTGGAHRIAVLLVDGYGYHMLPVGAPSGPTVREILAGRLGGLYELTSPFPSTTPTSLVSLGTGTVPGEHGILGFTLNVPGTDHVVTHIHWGDEPDPIRWQPLDTQFTIAQRAGVPVTVVASPDFAGTGLTIAANRGAPYRGANGVDELADQMLAALAESRLVYGYHPTLDREGHRYGVDSPEWRTAFAEVDRLLARLIDGLPTDAALLVTADHGQVNVPRETRFDADSDPRLRDGVRLIAGEPRVRYVHTQPGATPYVVEAWRAVLGDAAWVVTRDEAIEAGWFGPVTDDNLSRVGDVVAACGDRHVVLLSRTEPKVTSQLLAYHGSFTAPEMAIPLIVVPRD